MNYRSAQIFVLGLCILFGGGTSCFGQARAGATPPRIDRNLELERQVAARLARLTALVQPTAEKKLRVAAKDLIRVLVKQPPPADVEAAARSEVEKAFPGMSREQADLAIFFVLALVARAGAASLKPEDFQDQRDILAELTEMEELRLQREMDRMSKSSRATSNVLKKLSEVSDTIIQNWD